MVNRTLWGCAALLMLATSCAGASSQDASAKFAGYPAGWPLPVEDESPAQGCARIEGTYLSRGQSNSTVGERFSNPIFERSFFYLNNIAEASNRFKVSVNEGEQRIYFDILNRMKETLATKLHKNFSKCENGWLVVEASSEGGSGESPVRSTYSKTRFGPAEDGSLLVNSYIQGEWREHGLGREVRASDIWYRFEPVTQ